MKTYEVKDAFGLENLTLVDRPDPKPGPRQILVKVKATSVNYRDLLLVQGFYNPKQPLPIVPFSDGAGEVVDIGDEVKRFGVGDRVASSFFSELGGRQTDDGPGGSFGDGLAAGRHADAVHCARRDRRGQAPRSPQL